MDQLPVPPKILVVDDDVGVSLALARVLVEAGYEAVTADSVPSALLMMRDSRPDVLITDVRIGRYNGLHLLLAGPEPAVPTIVITGFKDAVIESDAHQLGAELLVKPVDSVALCALVARILDGSRSAG
jgi:DNA-binding NtrC family response regulator